MFFDKVPFKNLHNTNRVRSIYLGFWLIVESSNRARYLCLWSFYRHYRGGTPAKRIPESSSFNFRQSNQSSFYIS